METRTKLDLRDLLDEDQELLQVAIEALGNKGAHPNGSSVCALIDRVSRDLEEIEKQLE